MSVTLTGIDPDSAPVVAEIWAHHEALRRIGFSADDILVLASPGQLVVALQQPSIVYPVGAVSWTRAAMDFQVAWLDFVEKLSDGTIPDTELEAVWNASQAKKNAVRMLAHLIEKGVELPLATRPTDPASGSMN